MTTTAATKVFALIGDPVSQSLSPVLHNAWFADHRIDAVYVALQLGSQDASEALAAIKRLGLSGLNITVPHKQAAAQAADRSEAAVANVWRWEEDGSVSAFSTDGQGFLDSLSEAAADWRTRVRRALVVGAGGAATAIGGALSPYVDTVHYANRTVSRAEAAASCLHNGRVLRWEDLDQGFAAADLIVQATTLGMSGQPGFDWPVGFCQSSAIVADIVYRPLDTGLVRAARARGLTTADGLGMLIHQGARAFELWFGISPDTAQARGRLMSALAS
ncbi:MAG: shikimate dehydrogenase [Hyphomonadaceae bacterium]|nr:shikimate dehydrogenase [Hyphomonadaceae bacterium]